MALDYNVFDKRQKVKLTYIIHLIPCKMTKKMFWILYCLNFQVTLKVMNNIRLALIFWNYWVNSLTWKTFWLKKQWEESSCTLVFLYNTDNNNIWDIWHDVTDNQFAKKQSRWCEWWINDKKICPIWIQNVVS